MTRLVHFRCSFGVFLCYAGPLCTLHRVRGGTRRAPQWAEERRDVLPLWRLCAGHPAPGAAARGGAAQAPAQSLSILVYLLAHHERVVPTPELLEHLWPEQFVGDAALKSCITALRKVLGEQGRTARFVRTVHGQGYRFVAAVEVQESLPADVVPLAALSTASVRHAGATTPAPGQFVGRAAELTLLQSRLAAVQQGSGQVVGISGDPGIGKSRLLAEFCQGLAGHNVRYLEGHCLAYGAAIPGLPVLDLLRQHCQITEGDRPEIIPHKMHAGLQAVEMDAEGDAPFLLQLLGQPEGTERLARFSPETIKARTVAILQQLLLRLSRQQLLVVALEDLQWMDHTSTEFFTSLVDRLPGAALLLLTTYRSGYRPAWIEKSYVTQIALHPLAPSDSQTMLQARLPGGAPARRPGAGDPDQGRRQSLLPGRIGQSGPGTR